jgi:hypothetical protein
MDHLAASIELAVFRGCAICLCSPNQFAKCCHCQRPELSVQDLGELYMGSLLDTVLYIEQHERDHKGAKPLIPQSKGHLRKLLDAHSVHRFPALFSGNSYAQLGLLRLTARQVGLSDVLSSLSDTDRDRVQRLFIAAIELDAQVNRCPPITDGASNGFDLAIVKLCVPLLHCLKCVRLLGCLVCSFVTLTFCLYAALGKALLHLAMANPHEGSSMAAVERAILAAAGGNLKSIDEHCYAYNVRNVFCSAGAFNGCVSPLKQSLWVLGRLFGLPYMRSLSDLQCCTLAFAGMLVDPGPARVAAADARQRKGCSQRAA